MAGGAEGSDASFDLTPMIDVILLLIIFFMLSSQFATSELRPVDLPREPGVTPSSESASAKLVIDIDREGRYSILGEPLELSALATRLTSSQGASGTRHSGIVVRADRNGNSVALNRLASALAAARIDNWSIAVTPEGAP
jgi:biopolymer transport protein ExbD